MKNKGFALLFSLIIMTAVTSVSFAVYNIIFKQLRIASISNDAQIAFYAADAGLECVFNWDLRRNFNFQLPLFATSSISLPPPDPMNCLGVDIRNVGVTGWDVSADPLSATTEFELSSFSNNYCAKVQVHKEDYDSNGTFETNIISRGYNVPCDETTNPLRVERAATFFY